MARRPPANVMTWVRQETRNKINKKTGTIKAPVFYLIKKAFFQINFPLGGQNN